MNHDHSPLAILKDLIRIPSQNPMGHEPSGDGWFESEMSHWLCEFFAGINVIHEYHEIESGRGNVVARIEGDPDKPVVLLDAHQDTVPVAGMKVEPFVPIERDGRLYGRGSCDVKGAMASILATVSSITNERASGYPTILVSCSCDEERGQMGARDLVARFGQPDGLRTGVLQQKPDVAIVSEPTELSVVVAHKGTVRWKIETQGVACHSSNPDNGNNAIYAMGELLRVLQLYSTILSDQGMRHQRCGSPTLSVGTIAGGHSVNIVPDRCTIEIDRRITPGESIDGALVDVEKFLREQTDVDFRMLPPDTKSEPLADVSNITLATQLTASTNTIVDSSQVIGVPFTTHAPRFASLGIPTVVYGPGSISQAHTEDEWIEVQQLDQAHRSLLRFLKDVA